MYRRFHERFGSAAVVIAVIALIAALGGSALAARGGLSRKEKKEIKKYALVFSKRFAKRFAKPGPEGQQGAAGEKGATGDTGAPGENGKPGEKGEPGESVAMTELFAGECTNEEGGAKLEVGGSAVEVCNGEMGPKGEPWTPNSTLPSEATETGAWVGGPIASENFVAVPLSFPIQLEAELAAANVHLINTAGEEVVSEGTKVTNPPDCKGTVAAPSAVKGNLCVYVGFEESTVSELTNLDITNPTMGSAFEPSNDGASKAGADLVFGLQEFGQAHGTWAVTAP